MPWTKPIVPGPDELITREHFNNLADMTVTVQADTEKIDKALAEMLARLQEMERQEPDDEVKKSMAAVTAALASTLVQSRRRFSRRSLLGLRDK